MNLKKNPELIPLIEWWEKDGKSTLLTLAVVAAAFLGWQGWKHYQQTRAEDQSKALAECFTVGELENAVIEFKGTSSEKLLKIRLAKAYYTAERYEEALSVYTSLEGTSPEGFAGVAELGKAYSLEALEKYDEALEAFSSFVKNNGKSYLALTAKIGEARVTCEKGDKKTALEKLAALKEEFKGEEISLKRIEAAEDIVKRYVKREKRSLFDAANAVAEAVKDSDAAKAETDAAESAAKENKQAK